jgi:dTMP kinase
MKLPVINNFIVIEGIDGSGTSTQLELFRRKFIETGIKHHCTYEPTDMPVGKLIRSVLKANYHAEHKTIALLFAADRNEHVNSINNGILKNINDGKIVVCDRYLFSSVAYQSINCNPEWVLKINEFPLPEHLFFIDTPPEICIERMKNRREKEIFENIEFQKKVYKSYLNSISLFEKTGMKIHYINGTEIPDTIFNKIWNKLQIDQKIIS